ncbi:c-type cytochrome [uncultured Azohydromonas sp.]|jgi:Cytochrome c553|uniref:c-type cytochrome n=1 Tax=uncultured Azohydromonas sp. TaxID=487342 RepID=UPI00262F33EE|nr:c-type cytochrome [uncultured Azohydromonas sp.]
MKSILARTLQTALAPALALALATPLMAAEPAAPAKPDLAKGQATAQVCAACHAADGTRGISANPILQGQHPEYLVKQLTEFKAGKRQNPIMQGMAAALSEEDMRNVAAFYASKQAEPGAATDKELVQLGEKIYRGGIAERNIPACAGCHSPSGAGIPAQYPRLSGQHAEYTASQLNAFRAGTRANSAQMTGVAAKMNDREIKAVSDYIAGLR